MRLKNLQISCFIVLAMAMVAFSVWRYFAGGTWWLAAVTALLAYVAMLSSIFLGSADAWHKKAVAVVFKYALSSTARAGLSLSVLSVLTVGLSVLAYHALPYDTNYYEVRVFKQVDLPANYHVGASVILHTRSDGETHKATVAEDGAAVFRQVPAPTTLTYQVEISRAGQQQLTGGSKKVSSLPDKLDINTAAIADENWQRLSPTVEVVSPTVRPAGYLANVIERGDKSLQSINAPWGVPLADRIQNRLGYVLGYDLQKRMPAWVAYSVSASKKRLPRPQFMLDPGIEASKQAQPTDYRRSGYDRGHMISPADLYYKGPVTVAEAYYMTTVTPQTPWLNRRLWNGLEKRVREVAASTGRQVFITAGPLFIKPADNSNFQFNTIANGTITVPTHFFRIMAMHTQTGGIKVFAVVVPNATEGALTLDEYLVSVETIEQYTGLNFFPFLSGPVARQLKATVNPIW